MKKPKWLTKSLFKLHKYLADNYTKYNLIPGTGKVIEKVKLEGRTRCKMFVGIYFIPGKKLLETKTVIATVDEGCIINIYDNIDTFSAEEY